MKTNTYPEINYWAKLISESSMNNTTDKLQRLLTEIKSKIEFLTEAKSPEQVLDSMLEDPPEYKDMRNCIYEIYKLVNDHS